MPRNVRNWWVECFIDGRVSRMSGGPVTKDGGITLRIFQRDHGDVKLAAVVSGTVDNDGHLTLTVQDDPNQGLAEDAVSFDGYGYLTIQTKR